MNISCTLTILLQCAPCSHTPHPHTITHTCTYMHTRTDTSFTGHFHVSTKGWAAPWYLVMRNRPSDKVTDSSSGCRHLEVILKGEPLKVLGTKDLPEGGGRSDSRSKRRIHPSVCREQHTGEGRGAYLLPAFRGALPDPEWPASFLRNLAALLESQSLHPGCQLLSHTPC